MCALQNDYLVVDSDEEEDLGLFSVDQVDFSVDTQWYFEGAWLSLIAFADERYPDAIVGEAMVSEDDDGHLGVWARFDFGQSVLWLRVMTFSPFHWTWRGDMYN
jgi:hypothetical protein|tara:strand:- start:152 stop:463 length:312 start_codon:yes stop_codon:yes gene_type:complete